MYKTEKFELTARIEKNDFVLTHLESGLSDEITVCYAQDLIEYGIDQNGQWSDECFDEGCGEHMYNLLQEQESIREAMNEARYIARTQGKSQANYYINN